MVTGSEIPEIVNWALLFLADEIVTLLPIALTLEGCVVELPTATLPKFRAVGDTVSCAATLLAPVPLTGIVVFGPPTKMLPPISPVVCGAKETFTVRLCPGASTIGSAGLVTEKPAALVCNELMVWLQDRELDKITGNDAVEPTATDPNDTLGGLAVSD
jgi:hypothetical protein